jgi:hypothetical protein
VEDQQPKRSYFVPVLLLLLVISVMGNVLLYTKVLSRQQDDRVQRGYAIIEAGTQAKRHIDAVLDNVSMLLAGGDISLRLAAKGALGAAFESADEVKRFIVEAEKTAGHPFSPPKRDANAFFSEIEQSLQQIANHDGPLTTEERAYLQMVAERYRLMKSIAEPFGYSEVTRDVALTAQAGGAWVEIAKKLLDIMNGPDSLIFIKER